MKRKVDPTKARDLYLLRNDIMKKGFEKNISLECFCCHKKFSTDSENFITIYGNITAELDGGIIGNNFDKDGELFWFMYFCRNKKCWPKILTGKYR